MIVGIDFGTCYSCAAIMSGLIPVTNFIKDNDNVGIPSKFMFFSDENIELFGIGCESGDAFRHSADIIKHMKRTVRQDPANLDKKVRSGGREYTLSEVIEKYLTFLINEVRTAAVRSGEFRNTEIETVTITAPVGIAAGQMMASEYNRLLQESIMRITGLPREDVRVLQDGNSRTFLLCRHHDWCRRDHGLNPLGGPMSNIL